MCFKRFTAKYVVGGGRFPPRPPGWNRVKANARLKQFNVLMITISILRVNYQSSYIKKYTDINLQPVQYRTALQLKDSKNRKCTPDVDRKAMNCI